MMNVTQLIVQLNNSAVQCMSEGNTEGSVAALSSALSSLQVGQNARTKEASNVDLRMSLALRLLGNITSSNNPSPISSIELDHACLADSTCSFSIFNHMLTVSNACLLDADVSQHYERLQAMILYNLGLTLHYQSMRTGRSDELQGALDLYEMAFAVVENSWQFIDLQDLMLLLMGLLNNLGHIHSNLFNQPQTKSCIDWLQGLAGHPAFLNLIQREQYARFSMNLLVVLKQFERQHCSPAA